MAARVKRQKLRREDPKLDASPLDDRDVVDLLRTTTLKAQEAYALKLRAEWKPRKEEKLPDLGKPTKPEERWPPEEWKLPEEGMLVDPETLRPMEGSEPTTRWRRLMQIWSRTDLSQAEPPSKDPDAWLNHVSRLIPRKHREAMLGDLYEDRRDWRAQGSWRITVELITAWHLFLILLLRSKKLAFVALAVDLYRKFRGS